MWAFVPSSGVDEGSLGEPRGCFKAHPLLKQRLSFAPGDGPEFKWPSGTQKWEAGAPKGRVQQWIHNLDPILSEIVDPICCMHIWISIFALLIRIFDLEQLDPGPVGDRRV